MKRIIAIGIGAAIALGAGPAARSLAQAPAWTTAGLAGGPIYGLEVYSVNVAGNPVKADQQVVAAGNRVWTAARGVDWVGRAGIGPVDNIRTGQNGVIFADSATGQGWRSTTYGDTWISVRVRDDAPVHFLGVSPFFSRDSVALAATTADWRSFRFDVTSSQWVEVVVKPGERFHVGAAAFSPLFEADELVLLGTDKGIYRSTNGGQTWGLLAGPGAGVPAFGPEGGPIERQGIVFPDDYGDDLRLRWDLDDRSVFAYNTTGVYRSDDSGATWRRLPLNAERIYDLAVSNAWPVDPVLFAAVGQPGAVGAVSEDGGATWRWIAGPTGVSGTGAAVARDFGARGYRFPPIPGFDSVIRLPIVAKNALDGIHYEPVYRGSREAYLATDGDGIWRTQDGGATWDRDTPRKTLPNAQPVSLAFLPGGGAAEVLAGTEAAGVYRSPDGGQTWAWLETDLPRGHGQNVNRLAVSPNYASDRTVFAATASGVWAGREAGRRWSRLPGPAAARALALSPAFGRDRTLVADGQISTDGGAGWQPLPVVGAFPWYAAVFSPKFEADRTLWISRMPAPDEKFDHTVYRSQDAGQTWQRLEAANLSGRHVLDLSAMAVAADPIRLIAATDNGLYISQNMGAAFTRPIGTPGRRVPALDSRVLTQGATAGVVAAAADDGVFWSVTRGVDWARTPVGIANVRAVAWSIDGVSLLAAVPAGVARAEVGPSTR